MQSFAAGLVVLCVLERLLPVRPVATGPRVWRNICLQLLNATLVFILPMSMVGAALFAIFNQFGLFNQVTLGLWTKIGLSLLAIDFVMYWLHRAYHGVNFLWRFHKIHHSDQALDLSSTFRTHPVEVLITLGVRAGLVVLLGAPLIGVILYQIVLAIMAMFIHSNLRIWQPLDQALGLLLITPSRHRLHHDSDPGLMNSNFGLVLSIWDRLFGTLTSAPLIAAQQADTGSVGLRDAGGAHGLAGLLIAPFRPGR